MSIPSPAPARSRLLPKLALIWLLGACAVALAFGVLLNAWDGRPLGGLVESLRSPATAENLGPHILTMLLSLGGLLGAGLVWRRSWRRRLRRLPRQANADQIAALDDFIYPVAVWQGLVGYFAFCIAIGLLVTAGMTIAGSWQDAANLPQTMLVVLFAGAMGMPLNALNFLFVIPQVIWLWQRTAYRAYLRGLPSTRPDGGDPPPGAGGPPRLPGRLPPRGVLAAWASGLVVLVALDQYGAYRAARLPARVSLIDNHSHFDQYSTGHDGRSAIGRFRSALFPASPLAAYLAAAPVEQPR
ncbi:hypothetical protein [Achromobacter aloeverae]|uniref:Uncharacterized protein n=2 Tax=Achromobacter aloeverae TaxID=1750518 RepID=A0A4Q1HKK6_9BURK|nr:hypothetical protein C7R54_12980 [Achromobacter aloeverae]